MGCGDECPLIPGLRRDDWSFEDPSGRPLEQIREIRDSICASVRRLVEAEGWSREHSPRGSA